MKQKNRNERIVWIVCWSHDTLFLLYENEPGRHGSGDQSARSSPLSLNFSPPLWIPPWLRRVMVPSAPLRLPLPDISTREGSMLLSVSSHHRRPDSDPSHPTPCDASLFEKKKLPVHHKHPPRPFIFSAWGGRRKGGIIPLTAPSRLTWHQEAQCARRTFEFP